MGEFPRVFAWRGAVVGSFHAKVSFNNAYIEPLVPAPTYYTMNTTVEIL